MGRQELRQRIVLPVKVHGTNARGEPFTEMACVTDISQNGARIEGAQCLKNLNEIVTLEHQGAKLQFRVAWIGEAGTLQAGHAGLQTLVPQRVMFGLELPAPGPDSFDPNLPHGRASRTSGVIDRRVTERRHQSERRRHPRYKCSGAAEIRLAGTQLVTWARASDLCLGGCYVELSSPMPIDTPLLVTITICDEKMTTPAAVRSNHPGFGMGLQFHDTTPDQLEVLKTVVGRLAGGVPPAKAKVVAPSAAAARPAPQPAALQALVDWFRNHETMTRADFLRLIEHKPEEPKPADIALAS